MGFLLLWGTAWASEGQQKAWLLIAQDLDELESGNSYYRKKDGESNLDQLTAIFKRRMEPLGLDVNIVTGAEFSDLRGAMKDPTTAALFWLGHGSATVNMGGLSAQGVLLDSKGVNVADLFREVHPNVRWVGIVGCHAEGIIQQYRKKKHYRFNPVLKIDAPSGFAIASKDLAGSANRAWLHLLTLRKSYPGPICDWEKSVNKRPPKGNFLTISRLPDQPHRSTLVLSSNGTYLGSLTPQDGEITLWAPERLSLQMLEVVQLNLASNTPPLETLRIESRSKSAHWKVIANSRGEPMGQTRNVYRRRGEITPEDRGERPSNCRSPEESTATSIDHSPRNHIKPTTHSNDEKSTPARTLGQ